MTSEIPVTQAREELADLINRVAYGHERIILTRHSKPVACIVPPEDLAQLEEQEQERVNLAHAWTASDTPSAAAPDTPHLRPAVMPGPMPIAAQNLPPGQPRR
jgi:prevent-host-death family protein